METPQEIPGSHPPGLSAVATPSPLKRWVLASRPATLTAAVVPVLVGSAVAHRAGHFEAGPALAALAGASLIQIGTNFVNDVADFEKGADTAARLGPVRAVQSGLLTAGQMKRGALVAFALAVVTGVYLLSVGGWPVAVIGIASILSGIAYTAGPYPLGYNGLGDIFVLVFFGFVAVCGTVFVQAGQLPALAWLASVPVGALATAILVVNNVRDLETDVVAGKRTLAVRFGRSAGQAEYVCLLLVSYSVPLWLYAGEQLSGWILLPLLTLPIGVKRIRQLYTQQGAALNEVLAGTAKLLLIFGILFALGVLLSPLQLHSEFALSW